jgi:antitoxin ParD1/3/4
MLQNRRAGARRSFRLPVATPATSDKLEFIGANRMSKTYTSGPDADEIVAQQLAKGHFASADDVVRAGVQMLAEQDAEIAYLRKLIEVGDADIAEGRGHRYSSGRELVDDIVSRGISRLNQKS